MILYSSILIFIMTNSFSEARPNPKLYLVKIKESGHVFKDTKDSTKRIKGGEDFEYQGKTEWGKPKENFTNMEEIKDADEFDALESEWYDYFEKQETEREKKEKGLSTKELSTDKKTGNNNSTETPTTSEGSESTDTTETPTTSEGSESTDTTETPTTPDGSESTDTTETPTTPGESESTDTTETPTTPGGSESTDTTETPTTPEGSESTDTTETQQGSESTDTTETPTTAETSAPTDAPASPIGACEQADYNGDIVINPGAPIKTSNLHECDLKCQEDKACSHFTWIPETSPNKATRNNCWLKNGVGTKHPQNSPDIAISGPVGCSSQGEESATPPTTTSDVTTEATTLDLVHQILKDTGALDLANNQNKWVSKMETTFNFGGSGFGNGGLGFGNRGFGGPGVGNRGAGGGGGGGGGNRGIPPIEFDSSFMKNIFNKMSRNQRAQNVGFADKCSGLKNEIARKACSSALKKTIYVFNN